ncbi:MAG: universal stress protein [Gammaproteobacteria bacterium]|nr:universal stress protein [Gammaproteobacteria bacterium]
MNEPPNVILAPVDGSDSAAAAARYAAMLCQALGAPLRLLFVFPEDALHLLGVPPETAGENQIDSYSPERFTAVRDRRARHVFDGVRAQLDGVDVQIDETLLTGEPAAQIVAHAGATANPMIVMGRRGLSRMSELLMGSVSHRVVHQASCPVVVVNR